MVVVVAETVIKIVVAVVVYYNYRCALFLHALLKKSSESKFCCVHT